MQARIWTAMGLEILHIKLMVEMNNRKIKYFALLLSAILLISPMPAMTMASDWCQFQKDEVNSGWTTDSAPIKNPELIWYCPCNGCGWSGIDTTPIVADGKVFVLDCRGLLWAFHAETGDRLWEASCTFGGNFELSTPAYHNGIVYVATSAGGERRGRGEVTAVNANNGTIRKWKDHVTPEGFQLNTPVTYADGKIYVGSWKGGTTTTEDSGTYYCLDASDVTKEVWGRTAPYVTGYYGAGAAIVGDYIIFGDDRSIVTCLYKDNGTLVDYINISAEYGINAKEIRSSIVYNEGYERIYFTSKGGYAFAIGFDADSGIFNTSGGRDWNPPHYIGYSTSTPTVYDGRVYVGQGGFGTTGKLYCLNESDGSEIWSTQNLGGVQSSPALSIQHGEKYIYFTVNKENGDAYCLEDKGNTYEIRWIWNPPGRDDQYIMQGMAIYDGYIYFGTDEGFIYALEDKTSLKLGNVSNIAVDWGIPFTLNHSVRTLTASSHADNVTVGYNLSWILECELGRVWQLPKWCTQSVVNGTPQSIAVAVEATTTTSNVLNDTQVFLLNITRRNALITANPPASQSVNTNQTFWINGSAQGEYRETFIGSADLIREGVIISMQSVTDGNANFSRVPSTSATFNFSIRFYNRSYYNNATTTNSTVKVKITQDTEVFDTGKGTYPSIFGTHYGKIIPYLNITVNKIYTYPCAGTGGHSEFVEIWNETTGEYAVAEGNGYVGDYHNLSFNRTLNLQKDIVYSYIIKTGSYPQIIHAPYKQVTGGNITCTRFEDANGKAYDDWIPTIRLFP